MLFTIVFDEVGTLDTTDIKTAFQACGMTHMVSAVLDAETKEVLYGELPDWMLTPEEAKARAEKKELARKRAMNDKQARDALRISDHKRKTRVGGITRVHKGAKATKQYDNTILVPIPDDNWYTVVIVDMYDEVAIYRFNDYDEAEKRFKSALGKSWFSATMWANNTAIFKCEEGQPIWR